MTRRCAYPPCPVEFVPGHPEARFCSGVCRTRDWKERRGYGAQKTVRTDVGGPGGVQLSWGPALRAAVQIVYDVEPFLAEQPELALGIAEKRMREAAPARQRARLEARER